MDQGTGDYFRSYEDLDVHELMLKDEPRTLAYLRFMEQNEAALRDKVVVDVGAGTGILSLFAARAGAKHVYAIEASDVAHMCEAVVIQNNLQTKVTVVKGRAEEVNLPDGVKADVLVSEWMGFYLLHESMLESVLAARDRFLAPGGLMLPSAASLFVCPVSMAQLTREKFDFWRKVYGFDFSPVLPHVKRRVLAQPQIETLQASQLLGQPELAVRLELAFVEPEDIKELFCNFNFELTRNGVLHGLACWFTVEFDGDCPVELSTAPGKPETHWKQTVVLLPDPLLVSKGDSLAARVVLRQDSDRPRRYNICVELAEEEEEEGSEGEGEEGADDVGQVTDLAAADLIKAAMTGSNT